MSILKLYCYISNMAVVIVIEIRTIEKIFILTGK